MDINEVGLTEKEVIESRKIHGLNILTNKSHSIILSTIIGVVSNPVFLMLTCCSVLYFIMGLHQEGIFVIAAILFITSISIYQENKSKKAIHLISKLTAARALVKRNNIWKLIPIEEIVVGDSIKINEGEFIPADGNVIVSNDLSINEAVLTGESMPIEKSSSKNNVVYRSTMVIKGRGIVKISQVGMQTQLGKITTSVDTLKIEKTPFQKSISVFIKKIVLIGIIIFLFLLFIKIIQSQNVLASILQGLTLAMSVLPEEIPVALASFEAMGSYLLLKKHNLIVKQPSQVETLGMTSVICLDKTGTITENQIKLDCIYDVHKQSEILLDSIKNSYSEIIEYAQLSSECNASDSMEIEVLNLYNVLIQKNNWKNLKLIREYPLKNSLPIMTHVFKTQLNEILIAAKGAPEILIEQSKIDDATKSEYKKILDSYTSKGRRVIGVAKAFSCNEDLPTDQNTFKFVFLGFLVYKDPIRTSIENTIRLFYSAGIHVKMITGDHALTGKSIAEEIGLKYTDTVLLGAEVMSLQIDQLIERVEKIDVFARMFPEAKLKVIEALKIKGEIVAMTGDGVNDAPALKAAHIGVAMGKSGTEIAKESSSIIIRDDDLSHLIPAIAVGRKIYHNLKKAFRYIISIHIPIFVIVIIPVIFNWKFSNLFSPIHVIFLELIMGPTCSIIFENEPIEEGVMSNKPISLRHTFISKIDFLISFIQGIVIALGCIGLGYCYLQADADEITIRTMVFITLLFSNIFLILINRSFKKNILVTLTYKNSFIWMIISICFLLIVCLVYNKYLNTIFDLRELSVLQMIICIFIGFFCTIWIELFKKNKKKIM